MGTADGRKWSPTPAINCIVDDSALLAGLREDDQDNLKRWVKEELVNVFVPLYTLERLSSMRVNSPAVGNDARKTLEWLDRVTSATENKSVGRVQLQGPDHQYQTWQEVENYLLPDTPLSKDKDINARFARLSMDSHDSADIEELEGLPSISNGAPQRTTLRTTSTGIPAQVRPLLNFVVWRAHHEDSTLQHNGRYILLTNDRATQKQAQKFGVRAKLVSQLRNVFAREDRPSQKSADDDRQSTFEPPDDFTISEISYPNVVDEPIFEPLGHDNGSSSNILDPNHFGRSPPQQSREITHFNSGSPTTSRDQTSVSRGSGSHRKRGNPGGRSQRSDRGTLHRERRGNDLSTQRFATRGGRAGSAPSRSRGNPPTGRQARGAYTRPIDPDSYARPARMRGQQGRLWEPQ